MSLRDDIALFSRVPLFDGLNEEQLRLLAFGAERRHLAKGEILFRAGGQADCAYVVAGGLISLAAAGKPEAQTMEDACPATLLCELAMISSTECRHTATALDDTEVIRIPRSLFMRLLEEYPEVAVMLDARIRENIAAMVAGISALESRFR